MKSHCRSSASMSFRRKRVAGGSMRLSSLRSSGLCTLRCGSRRRSGSGTTWCGPLRLSGSSTLGEQQDESGNNCDGKNTHKEGNDEVHTYMDLVPKVMWVAKQKVLEEFGQMTMQEMMGKRGASVLFAWAHT